MVAHRLIIAYEQADELAHETFRQLSEPDEQDEPTPDLAEILGDSRYVFRLAFRSFCHHDETGEEKYFTE